MTNLILKRQLQKNKKKGFTLIELIVVIVIIAIIAAIAVPALTRYINSANNRAAQAQAHNIQVVLQAEVTEFYETELGALVIAGTAALGSPLFLTLPPHAPAGYPGTTGNPDASIGNILVYNGVTLGAGATLTNIRFDNRRLAAFTYVHTNGATVQYLDGVYSFPEA